MNKIDTIYKEIERHGLELKNTDKALIEKAYHFAEKTHTGQERMNGEPYINHVYATGYNCARFGMGAVVISAALLHDTIEDGNISSDEVKKEFGAEILFLVEGVTKLGKVKYQGKERHAESLRKFLVAMAEDVRVLVIKIADRLHNLKTLEHIREDKRKRIALESIEIYASVAERLGMASFARELQDFAFPYAYPKEYTETMQIFKHRKKTDERYMQKVQRSLRRELAEQKIEHVELSYRIKGMYSLYKKLIEKDMDIEKVYDIIALRIVVPSIEICYRVLGIIHAMWRPVPGRIKDYIALPKPNGYQSLHTTIFTGDGGIAEIQIRTPEMNGIAQYGAASHYAYKNRATTSKQQGASIGFNWLQQLQDLQKEELHGDAFIQELKTDLFEDRIFIFTPKGDIIDLPKGSSVIDFAYAVHSDLGNHVIGAKVNNKHKGIKTQLHNKDIVEIITSKTTKPSSKWLGYVKTSLARRHIKNATKNESIISRFFG